MEVIQVFMESSDKAKLRSLAQEYGLTLSGYCRMLLLKEVKNVKIESKAEIG